MIQLEKILLATDFGKSSHKILKSAITLAKAFQSEIIPMHVLPNNIINDKARILLNDAAIDRLDLIHQKIKREGIKTAKPILAYGNHFEKIILTADSNNVNMILIGAGEKLKSDVFQLGTTAEKIIKLSNRPVWVEKKENNLNVRSILCPIDFSKESEHALKNAITMSRRFKAELIVFSVYEVHNLNPPNDDRSYWVHDKELVLSSHKDEFNLFLKNFDLTDLYWKKEIQIGDPAVEILKALKKYKSDLLIIGTTGKSGLTRILMGSVTEKVIREVPCSFITLKSEDHKPSEMTNLT